MTWLTAAQEVVERGRFVIVRGDGSFGEPTEEEWRYVEATEVEESLGQMPPEPDGVLLDHVTASMLVKVHAALGPAAREQFAELPLERAVTIGWRLSTAGPDVKVVQSTDIGRCPKGSLLPAHYRRDGSCRCNEREAAITAERKAKALVRNARQIHKAARAWLDST